MAQDFNGRASRARWRVFLAAMRGTAPAMARKPIATGRDVKPESRPFRRRVRPEPSLALEVILVPA